MHWMIAALQRAPAEDVAFTTMVRANLAAYGRYLPRIRQILPREDSPSWPAFSADGKRLVATLGGAGLPLEEGLVRQWDTATGRPVGLPFATNGKGRRAVYRPDGLVLATPGPDGLVRLWDAETGRPLGPPLPASRQSVRALAFSPDGRLLLTTSGGGGRLRLWSARDGTALGPPFDPEGPISSRAFRPDGGALVTGTGSGSLCFWDTAAAPILMRKIDVGKAIPALAWSPDGKVVATAELTNQILRFYAATGAPLDRRIVLRGRVDDLAYSPDGLLLLSFGGGGVGRLWDADTDQPLDYPLLRQADSVGGQFHPTRPVVLVRSPGAGASIIEIPRRVWGSAPPHRADGADLQRLVLPGLTKTKPSELMAFDPGRTRVVVQGKPYARIYDVATGQPLGRPIANRWSAPGPLALSPDGAKVAVVAHSLNGPPGTADCSIALCDVVTGRPLCPPINPINSVVALAFSPDGRWLATGDYSEGVQLWDAATGAPLGPRWPQANIVISLAFSPDGKRLAVGSNGDHGRGNPQVRLWDVATRRPLGESRGSPGDLLFSPDGATLLAVGGGSAANRRCLILDGRTARPIAADLPDETYQVSEMVFRPDGRAFVVATHEGTLELRDAQTGRLLGPPMALPDALLVRVSIRALAFSPDGATIAAGYADGAVRLWDAATGQPIGPPLRHERLVAGVAFTPDGKALVSVSEDGDVQTWTVPAPPADPSERLALRLEVDTGMGFLGSGEEVVVLAAKAWDEQRRRLAAAEGTSDAILPGPIDFDWHEATARSAERKGKWFTARFHLDHLIAARPGDGLLLLRRAWVNATDGRPEAAEADLRAALKVGPRDACLDLLVHKALDAGQARRLELALWALDRVIDGRPEDWQRYDDRAAVLEALGRPAERDADRDRAVAHGADSLYLVRLARARDVPG
jgi:WD40 repeat protein